MILILLLDCLSCYLSRCYSIERTSSVTNGFVSLLLFESCGLVCGVAAILIWVLLFSLSFCPIQAHNLKIKTQKNFLVSSSPTLEQLVCQFQLKRSTLRLELHSAVVKYIQLGGRPHIMSALGRRLSCICTCAVRANLYQLLGVFAAVYPEHMIKYSNRLLEVYVKALKAEVTLLLVFLSSVSTDNEVMFFGLSLCMQVG